MASAEAATCLPRGVVGTYEVVLAGVTKELPNPDFWVCKGLSSAYTLLLVLTGELRVASSMGMGKLALLRPRGDLLSIRLQCTAQYQHILHVKDSAGEAMQLAAGSLSACSTKLKSKHMYTG